MADFFNCLLENNFKILSGILGIAGSIIAYLNYKRANKIKKLEDEIEHLEKVNLKKTSKADPGSDRRLIIKAGKSIQILGINALGILHHCREEIINFLEQKNGVIQIILLDPSKKCFQERVLFEKDSVDRIKSEWLSSIKIIKDILNKTKGRGKIELKLFNASPDRSLLIIDALVPDEVYKASMLINYYPQKFGIRGYEGGQFFVEYSLLRDRDSFEKNRTYFTDLWRKYELIDINTINGSEH